jgi:hypothetical protein
MRVNEQRALVLPVVTDTVTKKVDDKDVQEEVVRVYAFHTPISREVFEANFRVLAATKAALSSRGVHYLHNMGPRIAALTLRDEGKRDAASRGMFDKDGNVIDAETDAFFAELKRLTLILCPGQHGWEQIPVDAALSSGKVDAEDVQEALASIVFFTCLYAMAKKADRESTARVVATALDASITSSAPTEFLASLPNSTPAQPTTSPRSSIPS